MITLYFFLKKHLKVKASYSPFPLFSSLESFVVTFFSQRYKIELTIFSFETNELVIIMIDEDSVIWLY